MVKVTSVKKLLILVAALLICATFIFAACNSAFTPVSMPQDATPEGNGGSVVQYGEWLYYVNGYTADSAADNTYSDDVKTTPRIGSVVRIKLSEIEKLFALAEENFDNNDDYKTAADAIAAAVRGDYEGITGAETVVPRIYISSNTTSTKLTGIYIFDGRIYITTPNDQLTAGGNKRTEELVLMSYKLDGSDEQRHFTFSKNSAEIWLDKVDSKVVATYYLDSELHVLDVASGNDTLIKLNDPNNEYEKVEKINDVSAIKWDYAGKSVFFINSIGQICKLAIGSTEYEVVVDNDTYEIHDDHIETDKATTYEINNVNNGEVYYTKKDKTQSGTILYWNGEDGEQVAIANNVSGNLGWKGYVVKSFSKDGYYGINLTKGNGEQKIVVLERSYNEQSVNDLRVEGDTLYYTSDSVCYAIDLSLYLKDESERPALNYKGEPYAKSTSATGWAAADFLNVTVEDEVIHYVFALSSSKITVVKFNAETQKNSEKTVDLTLLPATKD